MGGTGAVEEEGVVVSGGAGLGAGLGGMGAGMESKSAEEGESE